MKKLSLGLGLLLGAWMAACTASTDDGTSAPEPARDDELNESKALGMTDVTILYPQPDKWEQVDDMLGPSSEDAKGELLPGSLFAQIADLPSPKMIGRDGNEVDPGKKLFAQWADNFAYLRVVGIRLDPCFGETTNLGANTCTSTIRLVAQFFMRGPNVGQPFFDSNASIHLFYTLPQSEFASLAKEMLALRIKTGLPLQKGLVSNQQTGVHPTIKEQGLRGEYANGLKATILKYAGEQTLTRIAFSVEDRSNAQANGYYNQQQGVPDSRWVFGGFEHRSGRLVPLNIASLGDYTGLQTVDTFPSMRGDKNLVTVNPAISISDDVFGAFNLVKNAQGQFTSPDAPTIEKGRAAARKLQNPGNYNAHNSDCGSCHMAKQALATLQPQSTDLDFKSYTFRLDATHASIGPFRMFGWEQGRPVISARVVNETANVLEYLNKNVMR